MLYELKSILPVHPKGHGFMSILNEALLSIILAVAHIRIEKGPLPNRVSVQNTILILETALLSAVLGSPVACTLKCSSCSGSIRYIHYPTNMTYPKELITCNGPGKS